MGVVADSRVCPTSFHARISHDVVLARCHPTQALGWPDRRSLPHCLLRQQGRGQSAEGETGGEAATHTACHRADGEV